MAWTTPWTGHSAYAIEERPDSQQYTVTADDTGIYVTPSIETPAIWLLPCGHCGEKVPSASLEIFAEAALVRSYSLARLQALCPACFVLHKEELLHQRWGHISRPLHADSATDPDVTAGEC